MAQYFLEVNCLCFSRPTGLQTYGSSSPPPWRAKKDRRKEKKKRKSHLCIFEKKQAQTSPLVNNRGPTQKEKEESSQLACVTTSTYTHEFLLHIWSVCWVLRLAFCFLHENRSLPSHQMLPTNHPKEGGHHPLLSSLTHRRLPVSKNEIIKVWAAISNIAAENRLVEKLGVGQCTVRM